MNVMGRDGRTGFPKIELETEVFQKQLDCSDKSGSELSKPIKEVTFTSTYSPYTAEVRARPSSPKISNVAKRGYLEPEDLDTNR
jgi:hypothetical protein